MVTPAEEMLAAADYLDASLAKVTPGTWRYDGPFWHHGFPGNPAEETSLVTAGTSRLPVLLGVPDWARNSQGPRRADANVRYAATMGPQVGRPLAAFLRHLAEFYTAQGWAEWPAGTERVRDLVRGILTTKETP